MNYKFEESFTNLQKQKGSLFSEDLSLLKEKTLAIDADILLKKVKVSPKKSLQEGHGALDMTLQNGIKDIINRFRNEFAIELIIVLDGLTPKYLSDNEKILEKSRKVWEALSQGQDSNNLRDVILQQYGVRFYQQEIINAAKATNCQFFVAPYMSSSQIAYFTKEEMVHACCGSSKILLYDLQQVIVDFNLDNKKFFYIDYNGMIKALEIESQDKSFTSIMVDYFILCGAQFNKTISTFQSWSLPEILDKMKECQKKKDQPQKSTGQVMIETYEKNENTKTMNIKILLTMRAFFTEVPPVLTTNLELGNLRRSNSNDFVFKDLSQFMGLRFNDEIYFYLSRGLIDPHILETISDNQIFNSIVMAPGMFIKEIWDSKEYKSLFYEAFNNLHEDFKEEDKMLEQPNNVLSQYYRDLDYKREEHYHLKWDISEKDIVDELDRQQVEDVSFVFVLKWFQHELRLSKDKRSSLLKHMEETTPINASELPKLKTEKELLTMCYFQYLESRKFLGANKDYLYGQLLQTAPQQFEQPILTFLELLKIFFPAGLDLSIVTTHKEFSEKYSLTDPSIKEESQRIPIILLSRVFSLFSVKCAAIDQGKEVDLQTFDFDLAQFSTYVSQLKQMMRCATQTILYRIFRSKRGDIALFQRALDMLAFNKEPNCIFGVVMKSILQRSSYDAPYSKFNGPITQEFPFLTMKEIKEALTEGCNLWKKVMNIHLITLNHQKASDELAKHFSSAQNFLVKKMKELGEKELAAHLESQ